MARQSVEQLKGTLRGELIQPGDTGYDAARKVYNAMIDRRPRLVLRCADVADVMAAVRFGAESGMPVAIRSGGHNAGGLGVCDDGLSSTSRACGGSASIPRLGQSAWRPDARSATWTMPRTPSAWPSPTASSPPPEIGGLTLGGGLGHLTRKCGLTIDNLLEADVVLADGRMVKAGPDEISSGLSAAAAATSAS